ncbi:30S ribosome-binding factor [subsurface metagenome]
MSKLRIKRVNELLQQQLSKLILKEFPQSFATVQRVDTTADLKTAKVWVSFLNFKNKQNTKDLISQIQEKSREFQNILAKSLNLKFIPKLEFKYDTSPEAIDKIDKILAKEKNK